MSIRVGVYSLVSEQRLVDRYADEEFFARVAWEQKNRIYFFPTDLRWENVWAYIGPPQGYLYQGENEDAPNPDDYLEFLIEVPLNGTAWYSRQILRKEQLDEDNLHLYRWILNEMVEMVDRFMEEGVQK